MRQSPSIVPDSFDRDIYLVLDDFGDRLGWAWPETDVADTDRATLIRHLLEGQYSSPVRIIAFNTAECWSRDVTEDIANDLQDAWSRRAEIPEPIEEFIRENATKKLARQLSFPI
jgi:hypothetical protein